MTLRENAMAVLRYQTYECLPIVSFGYWNETLDKWADEGHITKAEADDYRKFGDNSEADISIMERLGFDFNWNSCFSPRTNLFPVFDEEVLEVHADGGKIIRNQLGLIILVKPGIVSIPSEIGTSLTDRKSWNELYLPKLKFTKDRINLEKLRSLPKGKDRKYPIGLHCGSLLGKIRDMLGVEHLSYLYVDDEELYVDIIKTIADLSFEVTKNILKSGVEFDYAHYWEDICFKNGPLVIPSVFDEIVGPYYKRNSELLNDNGIDIISVDCDGLIDTLIPTWLNNGVNTMFPIEVGTWDASIKPWREKYGKSLRGVGGMNKTVFSKDFDAVNAEVERLKELVSLGGYIPCPDHRIAPDAKFENVKYYCEQMRKSF